MMSGRDLRPVAPLRLAPYLAPYGETDVTKSDLIDLLAQEQTQLDGRGVDLAVKVMLERMTAALVSGVRIEIRAFGSFSLHLRPPYIGRNPKTGEAVAISAKDAPRFKPGKELRDRANGAQDA